MATTTNGNTIIQVTSPEEFKTHVLEAPVPVLVDLWAPWCAPCRAQMPILEQVAAQAGDRARVVKINVDEAPSLAQSLRVGSIPTLLVYRGGEESKRFVGVQSATTLANALGL